MGSWTLQTRRLFLSLGSSFLHSAKFNVRKTSSGLMAYMQELWLLFLMSLSPVPSLSVTTSSVAWVPAFPNAGISWEYPNQNGCSHMRRIQPWWFLPNSVALNLPLMAFSKGNLSLKTLLQCEPSACGEGWTQFRRDRTLCKSSVQSDIHHLTDSFQSGFYKEGRLQAAGYLCWMCVRCVLCSDMRRARTDIHLVLCARVCLSGLELPK